MGDVSPTPHQLMVEAVVFWSIAVVIWIGRLIARSISNGGIRNLQVDDYIMSVTFGIYTTLLVLINISSNYNTNLFPTEQLPQILADPKDVANRVYGSKIVIGLEQCMLLSTWGVKTCLVAMYWKLTKMLSWHLFVKLLAGYVLLGFIVIEVTYFAVYCRPFHEYWAVPPQDAQCATYQHYSITQAVFNLSSDACMLIIPIPLLKGTQMSLRKKILLVSVLGLGVFVMIAAILNKYFNFHSPLTTIYQIWYIREASTAIYVANLMCWWPLLRKLFGNVLTQYHSRYATKQGHPSHPSGVLSGGASSTKPPADRKYVSPKRWWQPKGLGESSAHVISTSASQEAINLPVRDPQAEGHLEIWRKVDYDIEESYDANK
ncbi:hypothetical protein ANOM_000175 [Aspergillus nomiae NRRL 13137]|uniref:Rhodopsin domain-containing protein n=1 Tax=Aspergillus nomiae NRRL (strain ATCC 15546 / NRRL 13137 / CBS 260.88 / M93) TaxID=1509407 RepID=A0A0L1JIU2_ASPN3|nr:uncharacterized protein ANOM_000175 [Aspergillus nomiae NRRL 13137]KNG91666.1 hypothetical protein ANOM_000175 [Aspergillus nomiae NRRL 13137]